MAYERHMQTDIDAQSTSSMYTQRGKRKLREKRGKDGFPIAEYSLLIGQEKNDCQIVQSFLLLNDYSSYSRFFFSTFDTINLLYKLSVVFNSGETLSQILISAMYNMLDTIHRRILAVNSSFSFLPPADNPYFSKIIKPPLLKRSHRILAHISYFSSGDKIFSSS